ncbi:hypothetical protein BDV59DRAFT_63239 [Aspergillus ambiguus]|uniref:uncharacterized protein n=1 Tax=Aspergillus ambiguus TaxID=176160 RepID=UPI003CCDEAA5
MDTGGHPGVRSLLARFENQQANTTSPPSRGRSPVGSDTPGSTRPLSKVRASFIAVDGAVQSSPVANLRRSASTRSDSPAAPVRVRSFNSEEMEGAVQTPLASTPPSNGADTVSNAKNSANSEAPVKSLQSPIRATMQPSSTAKENNPPSAAPAKATSAAPKEKAPSATGPKSSVKQKPSANQAVSKPDNSKPVRTSKPAASSAAKEPTRKPSRAALNTTAKPSTRQPRSSMPAAKTTKPARLPSSATTPSLSSAAKSSTNGPTRKPSVPSRANNTTTSTTRKQSALASVSNERPSSRTSNRSTKPVDEGFLARMMRPTASSARKVHDKVDPKNPPGAKTTRTASKSVPKPASRAAKPKAQTSASAPSKEGSVDVHSQEASTQGDPPAGSAMSTSSIGIDGTAEWVEQHAIPSVPEEEVAAPQEPKDSVTNVAAETTEDAPQELAASEQSKDTATAEAVADEEKRTEPENNGTVPEAEPTHETTPQTIEHASEPASKTDEVIKVDAQSPTEDASDNAPHKPEELVEGVEKLSVA